ERLRELVTGDLRIAEDEEGGLGVATDGGTPFGKLRKFKSKITFASPALDELFVVADERESPLDDIISREQAFTVSFTDPAYSYSESAVFRNRRLPEELSTFLSCFVAIPALSGTTSEKGAF